MSMIEWAKREVELAKKNEREVSGTLEGECDYGCACYDSALKAYLSLMKDEHSGMSIRLTQRILNRLIDGKCLTPITDDLAEWHYRYDGLNGMKTYQHSRMSSVFKDEDADGNVTYNDVDRVTIHEADTDTYWHNGLADHIVNEMFPLTLPYYPATSSYVVESRECLVDRKNGDFDTIAIFNVKKPDGEVVEINRYFREPEDREQPTIKGWVETTKDEYNHRVALANIRQAEEAIAAETAAKAESEK